MSLAGTLGSVEDLAESVLAELFAGAQPHPRLAEIPSELSDWLLPVSWDRERLWAVDRHTRTTRIDSLRWHYDLPWWRAEDGRWFQVRPAEFLRSPHEFPEHVRRVAAADLRYPLHGIRRRGRIQVIDGIHRLVHADQLNRETVEVILLTAEDLTAIMS